MPLRQQRIVDHVRANPHRPAIASTPWWQVVPKGVVDWTRTIQPPLVDDRSGQMTPLKPATWADMLKDCPAKQEVQTVLRIINTGADIQFTGDRAKVLSTPNLRSSERFPQAITDYLAEEVAAGRIDGPFPTRPKDLMRIVPMGSVPKEGTKRRVILNYSAPDGESVNEEIAKGMPAPALRRSHGDDG